MESREFINEERGRSGSLSAVPRARVLPLQVGLAVLIAGLLMMALLVNNGSLEVPPQFGPTLVGTPLSYSEALRYFQALIGQEPGGPWRVSSALGIGTGVGISGAAQIPHSTRSCTETLLFTGNVEYPATPESAPPGYVSSWSIEWVGAEGGVLNAVIWNTSILMGEFLDLGSGNCSGGAGFLGAVPESMIDSPNASIAADLAGGDTWLLTHQSNETFLSLSGTSWLVTYATCSAYQLSGYGSIFSANVNASTGIVNSASPSVGYSCAALWGL